MRKILRRPTIFASYLVHDGYSVAENIGLIQIMRRQQYGTPDSVLKYDVPDFHSVIRIDLFEQIVLAMPDPKERIQY